MRAVRDQEAAQTQHQDREAARVRAALAGAAMTEPTFSTDLFSL